MFITIMHTNGGQASSRAVSSVKGKRKTGPQEVNFPLTLRKNASESDSGKRHFVPIICQNTS